MFTMEVPYVPAQETPIVLAQAGTASAAPQPDFILNACDGTASAEEYAGTALRGVDPGVKLALALNHFAGKVVISDYSMIKNITLLESTKHGELVAGTSTSGRTAYRYDPTPNYVGKDRAVFMADYEGKHYKIVVNLKVSPGLNNELCPDNPYQLIKVNKPTSGSSDYGNGFGLDTLSVTFADLEGAAIGQTTGSTITLDTNAANYNWYIDPTPGQNEEYLPTSNPNEWVAKAGSAAAGKMDILSVLLHEYGHTLGINHSPDSHDYMATTLTPGVRRLPTAEELALMQRLVGRVKEEMVAGAVGAATSTSSGRALAVNDSRTFAEFATLSPSPSPASGGGEFERLVRRF